MMQHVQNLGKIKKSTNLVPEYNPEKIDKVSFMMSLRITLWRSMPLKFRLNTAKRKNKIVQVNQIKKVIKIFCRPSRMRNTNCFINYVQHCISPFQGGGYTDNATQINGTERRIL